jgi:catechol 2,3-dioxygenase-like lactoylglutathione lyase family enzyme
MRHRAIHLLLAGLRADELPNPALRSDVTLAYARAHAAEQDRSAAKPRCTALEVDRMTVRLEHANLFVRDIDATIRFLQTAFPEFRIRFDGIDPRGFRWVHVGTDDTYIALTQSTVEPEQPWTPYAGVPGVNHLAYEVDDVEALGERLKSAGYRNSTVPNNHPFRTRAYFYDRDGNDWEFVQYLSDDPAKRHDYTLPDK